ncbi:MAG: hypothetical protein ABII81_08420 [Pseudomonadota bacterium]
MNNSPMKLSKLFPLISLLLLACDAQGAEKQLPLSETREDHKIESMSVEIKAHRYSGDLTKLEEELLAAGYKKLNGMMVKGGDATHPYHSSDNVATEEWCILDLSKQPVVAKRCVYAVQSIVQRDSRGNPRFQTEGALEFSPVSGFDFLDDDTNCASPLYPYRTIVAIGRFKLREGRGNGGYAEDIRQAWVIDIEARKFVEISTKEVTCEVNEDRD